MMDIMMTVEEIAISGGVSLGQCSASTLYRWCKAINEYLERNKYEWRVKADKSDMSINVKED